MPGMTNLIFLELSNSTSHPGRAGGLPRAIIEKYHGEYIIRSGDVTVVTGTLKPVRIILIRFPNEQAIKECFDSPEYRQISPLRERSTESRAFFVNH